MVSKKKVNKKKFSNRLLYSFVAVGILLLVVGSVYALDQNLGWHPGTQVDFTGVTINPSSVIASTKMCIGTTAGACSEAGLTVITPSSVTSGAFYYSSDRNLKDNIQVLTNSLEKVNKLEGVSFVWKDTGRQDIGLIAQDVEKVLPELVLTNNQGLKSVEYGNLIALLIEAVKEQQKEIDELKTLLEEE